MMIDGLPGLTVKSHLTNFSSSSGDLDATNRMYVIESFRVMFTALGITIGIVGIFFNTALIISSTIMNSMLTTFSLKTRNLIISLAAADIFLLVFGLPYDLAAANDYPWIEGRAGCQTSAYLPEMSRFVWVGSVMLSLPLHRPSIMKERILVTTWTVLIWIISLTVAIPFVLRVDCLSTSHTSLDFTIIPEETMGRLAVEEDGTCSCVFTVSQSEVAQMFGSSLVVFSFIPIVALLRIGCKCISSDEQTVHLKRNTSLKTLAFMLLAFMGCTLPRYVYLVVNYSELPSAANGDYELALSAIEILSYCLFYSSTLIHLLASPHPRFLLRRLFNSRKQDYAIRNQAA